MAVAHDLIWNDRITELRGWRRQIHQHPETAFEEFRTAALIAGLLRDWGIATTEGVGGTGVVGVLQGRGGDGAGIGLRADMDALHVHEENSFSHASTREGKMHACGHDGHTAMLLGAARELAANPDFAGRVVFIFQPAEEGEGGGKAMVEDGLFERFPVDAVYALHNWPGLPVGAAAVHDHAVMAAFLTFRLRLTGKGCHAAMPHLGTDVLLAGAQLVTQLQGLVSREVAPHESAVVSVTSFHAGSNYNVIPEQVEMKGTVRCFEATMQARLEQRLRAAVDALSSFHGLRAELDIERRYPATINDPRHAQRCADALAATEGVEVVHRNLPPSMGSEDFAFLLEQRPGAYIWLGNGENCASLHNPRYDFNDALLPIGVRYWLNLVQSPPV